MYCERTPSYEIMSENIHKHLYHFYGSAMVDRSTTGHWVRGVMPFKEEQQSFMTCLAQGVCYVSRTRHGTNKAYTLLFLTGTRPHKWLESLW